MQMHWRDDYKIEIRTIDAQHKQLFNTYTELNQALRDELKPPVIKETLDRLQLYITRHFTIEEKHMRDMGYSGLEEQMKAHKYFRSIFSEILTDFTQQGLTPDIVTRLQNELGEWLLNHVLELDMEFGRFYNSREKST